jgi:PAS domain S-box-containing protein
MRLGSFGQPRAGTPDRPAARAPVLLTTGSGEQSPVVPGTGRDDWPPQVPKSHVIEKVPGIQDEIEGRVAALVASRGWLRLLDADTLRVQCGPLLPRPRLHSDKHKPDREPKSNGSGSDNPFRAAVDAAGMGTWCWDISSGRVEWTSRTYQLFGRDPGAFVTSHATFLQSVHPEDRAAVERWCERALLERERTMLEFRIIRADGSVRWMRSTGRAMVDERGQVVQMVGVVADVTEEKEAREPLPSRPEDAATKSLSARQVAQILGVAEVTVKRIAAAGEIEFLRSSRKDSRRFAPEQVVEYLRRQVNPGSTFGAAARSQDIDACLLVLMERLLGGTGIEELLDAEVRPLAGTVDATFLAGLLARLPFMVAGRERTFFPALVARSGCVANRDVEFVRCVLRAYGHEVLTPAENVSLTRLPEIAERTRVRIAVLLVGADGRADEAASIGGEIAHTRRTPAVCLWSAEHVRPAAGVVRIASMRDLGAVLHRL